MHAQDRREVHGQDQASTQGAVQTRFREVETQAIDDLAGSLRTLSAEVADKIKELQKLDGYEQIEDDFRIFFCKLSYLPFFLQHTEGVPELASRTC